MYSSASPLNPHQPQPTYVVAPRRAPLQRDRLFQPVFPSAGAGHVQVSCSGQKFIHVHQTATPQEGRFTLVPPTVFKELQVSVSVMEELNVVIG